MNTTFPLRVPAAARATLRRWALRPGWIGAAAVVAFSLLRLELPVWALYAPFVLSLLVLGLPHGAADPLVLVALRGRRLRVRPLLAAAALYLVPAGLYAAAWIAAPAASFVFFIALTWFHWGQGDVHALLALHDARHLPHPWQRALAAFVRGGLPMLVPLLAFPHVYRDVAALVVARIDPAAAAALDAFFGAAARTAAGALFGAAVAVYLVAGRLAAPDDAAGVRAWRADAGETLALLALFALVHPVLAVGLYFCLWHAPRHIARLVLLDGPSAAALGRGRAGPALRRFTVAALPATLGAVVLLGAAALVAPYPPTSLPAWTGLYLILIAVLTLPHVIVVAWMDRAQGVWRTPAAEAHAAR